MRAALDLAQAPQRPHTAAGAGVVKVAPFTVDSQQLAGILGLPRARVLDLVAKGLPVARRGSKGRPWAFDLRAVVPWWGDYREQLGGEAAARLDPKQERARLDRATAEIREHELAVRRGEYVPATDQDHVVIALASVTSGRLQAVPSVTAVELASATTPAECNAIVTREIHRALSDLAAAGDEAARRAEAAA